MAMLSAVNGSKPMYGAVLALSQDSDEMQRMTEEERSFVFDILREFERDGIHLNDADRERLHALQHDAAAAGDAVSAGAFEQTRRIELNEQQLGSIPAHLRRGITAPTSLPAASGTARVLLEHAADRDLRARVLMLSQTGARGNAAAMAHMLAARHRLAAALGFSSYANMVADANMVASGAEAEEHLLGLARALRPAAEREMSALRALAPLEGVPADGVREWDEAFLRGRLLGRAGSEATGGHSQLFAVDTVHWAAREVARRGFGLLLTEEEAAPGELWAHAAGIVKYRVTSAAGGDDLGTMYVDILPRPGKFRGAAHFVVRCGRELMETGGGEFQQPKIVLSTSTPVQYTPTGVACTTFPAVQTLFHELGHALHSLLSRTRFQHFSGTRCMSDFVEVPSNVLELFASSDAVLGLFAERAEALDAEAAASEIERINLNRVLFRASKELRMIQLALFDLRAHGPDAANADLDAIWAQCHADTQVVPTTPGTHPYTDFAHLSSYGAFYYSYVYGSALAGGLWARCFADDPLNPAAGDAFRRKVLAHGGARHPLLLLEDMLGAPVTIPELLAEHAARVASEHDAAMQALATSGRLPEPVAAVISGANPL